MKVVGSVLLGAALLMSACNKTEPAIENQTGTMRVFENAACNVYIQLDAGSNIYPVNTDKIQQYLVDGKKVTVSYRLTSEYVSPCANAKSGIIEEIR